MAITASKRGYGSLGASSWRERGGAAPRTCGASRAGRVEEHRNVQRWRVVFPDVEHEEVSSYLRELAVSDCSSATLRSYAYALLRWFRFCHDRLISWDRAERIDVREFVEHLRETPNPQRLRRRPAAPTPGSLNPRTGKPVLGAELHEPDDQSSAQCVVRVLRPCLQPGCWSFGEPGPGPAGTQRRAGVRPSQPDGGFRSAPAGDLPAEGAEAELAGDPGRRSGSVIRRLACNRDRALVSFWLSSGARASELIGLRHGDVDVGAHTITVVSKGSRLGSRSRRAWTRLCGWRSTWPKAHPPSEGGPLWWTRQGSNDGR